MTSRCTTTSTARAATPRRRQSGGFTLVEVLAALVLLAIVLPAVMRGVSVATGAASAAQKRTTAAGLAASKLQEIIATGQYTGGMSGDFADEGAEFAGFKWEAVTGAWNQQGVSQADIQPQTLEQLDLKVTWKGRTGEQSYVISTLVYSNPPLGPEAQPVENTAQKRGPAMGNVSGGGI